MQEEVEQKTVNLAVTTTKLTGRVAVMKLKEDDVFDVVEMD